MNMVLILLVVVPNLSSVNVVLIALVVVTNLVQVVVRKVLGRLVLYNDRLLLNLLAVYIQRISVLISPVSEVPIVMIVVTNLVKRFWLENGFHP